MRTSETPSRTTTVKPPIRGNLPSEVFQAFLTAGSAAWEWSQPPGAFQKLRLSRKPTRYWGRNGCMDKWMEEIPLNCFVFFTVAWDFQFVSFPLQIIILDMPSGSFCQQSKTSFAKLETVADLMYQSQETLSGTFIVLFCWLTRLKIFRALSCQRCDVTSILSEVLQSLARGSKGYRSIIWQLTSPFGTSSVPFQHDRNADLKSTWDDKLIRESRFDKLIPSVLTVWEQIKRWNNIF